MSKHRWQRVTHTVEVERKTQDAKSCSVCGMERTRDFSTASLFLFRARGKDGWSGYRAGFIPKCVPPERPTP